ncbi:hypothetical protein [Micromonospora sp. NPDC049497]|uniref:hypothetical protein n=1 Tax=Micromonospora sp. NPDC049497 TaxID=3364273 RepID=UPI0037945959
MVAALALLGVLIAAAALARDYFDVTHDPGGPGELAGTASTVAARPAGTPEVKGTTSGATAAAGVHLDALPVQGGGANLVPLPRALQGRTGYDRAVTISCPRNTNADKNREVVYPLLRRYVDVTTSVRPYFPDDPQAKAYVSATISVRQADGTVNRLDRGGQEARQNASAVLSADVEGADELTLRVRCESPTGLVVLTDAWLTAG